MKTKWNRAFAWTAALVSLNVAGCLTEADVYEQGDEAMSDGDLGEEAFAYTAAVGGPNCAAVLSKTTGDVVLASTLSGSCTDPNGDAITLYYLTCGNGSYYLGPASSKVCSYTGMGTYQACVQAMDATGTWGSQACKTVTATSSAHAEHEIWAQNEAGYAKCATILADGTYSYSNGGTITSYNWNIGGTAYSGATVTQNICYYYGTMSVSLTVTDSLGNTDTQTGYVTVCPKFYKDKGFCGAIPPENDPGGA